MFDHQPMHIAAYRQATRLWFEWIKHPIGFARKTIIRNQMFDIKDVSDAGSSAPPALTPCPAQQLVIDRALRAMTAAELVIVTGERGSGRTFVLKELQRRRGGKILTAADLMELTASRHARRYEQSLYELIRNTLAEHRFVYFDDVSGFQKADRRGGYNRTGLISAVLRVMRDVAMAEDKRIVVTTDYLDQSQRASHLMSGGSWDDRGIVIKIPALDESDYRHVLATHLGAARLARLRVAKLHAGSRMLTAKSLTLLSRIFIERSMAAPTAEDALSIVNREILHGMLDLGEVENVSIDDLVGVEAIAARIDRAILLPLNEPDLARELGVEPKHGVLLYGAPGTGKTTIGRALAHLMRGKFFLIDGDFVHDGPQFQSMVDSVFDAAIRSSPSVIFIDDADVIMTDPATQHFCRYLLTKLDGLQSELLANVCVIMTAMNIASMPPALLRSGRLEVWLEMKLPDAVARARLIRSYAGQLPFANAAEAVAEKADGFADTTEGFTPADLRRLIGDAAGRMAFDRHRELPDQPFGNYITTSIAELKQQKRLAENAIGERGGLRFY